MITVCSYLNYFFEAHLRLSHDSIYPAGCMYFETTPNCKIFARVFFGAYRCVEDEGITFPSLSRTVINNMAASEEASDICVIVKWSGKEYPIEHLSPSETVRYLKDLIKEKTGVLPERQKLLGLKFKGILKK